MASAAVDVIGHLPAPVVKGNKGACDILEGQLFAYGVGSGVAIIEVQHLQLAGLLRGPHKGATVTAVKWCPECHSRELSSKGQLRLASGDSDGNVVVWDVLSGTPLIVLGDLPAAQQLYREYLKGLGSFMSAAPDGLPPPGAISALAWIMPKDPLLAVLVAPGLLLLWDTTGGFPSRNGLIWWRDFGIGPGPQAAGVPGAAAQYLEVFQQLVVDPLNGRRLCLCGSQGALVLLTLVNPEEDQVEQNQYRANVYAGSDSNRGGTPSHQTLQATFALSHDLLFVLMPRELLVFDLEIGAPISTTPLPKALSRTPFTQLLGVYGEGSCQGLGDEGGVDFVYACHSDGQMSTWVRIPGQMKFNLGGLTRLLPPLKKGSGPGQVSMLAVRSALWKHQYPQNSSSGHSVDLTRFNSTGLRGDANESSEDAHSMRMTSAQVEEVTKKLKKSLVAKMGADQSRPRKGEFEPMTKPPSPASGRSVLVMAITSDGRLWEWDVLLPKYPARTFLASCDGRPLTAMAASLEASAPPEPPEPVLPHLEGLLHGLPSTITCFSWSPRPVVVSSGKKSSSSGDRRRHRPSSEVKGSSVTGSAVGATEAPAAGDASGNAGSGEGVVGTGGSGSKLVKDQEEELAVAAGELVVMTAAATASGYVELVAVRRGPVTPLAAEVLRSFWLHPGESVKGVKWLGTNPWLVSYSTGKAPKGATKNTLLLTDITTGHSVPFRTHVASDPSPLVGLRASPTGSYLLVMFKEGPAELWAMPKHPAAAGTTVITTPSSSSTAAVTMSSAGSSSATATSTAGGDSSSSATAAAEGTAATRGGGGGGSTSSEGVGGAAAGAAAGATGSSSSSSSSKGAGGGAQMPAIIAPFRLRLLDLRFTAVEWVMPDQEQKVLKKQVPEEEEPVVMENITIWERNTQMQQQQQQQKQAAAPPETSKGAAAPGISSAAGVTDGPSGSKPAPTAPLVWDLSHMPEERLAFCLADGRSGVLSVRGRKVIDIQPKRPTSGVGPHEVMGTALAGLEKLLFLGDAEGKLLAWDTSTGKCSLLVTGQGPVERIRAVHPTPIPASAAAAGAASGDDSSTSPLASNTILVRVAVIFVGGSFGVYELDGLGKLKASAATPQACGKAGKVTDIGWLPVPRSIGKGSFLGVATEDGALCLMEIHPTPPTSTSEASQRANSRSQTPSPFAANSSSTNAAPPAAAAGTFTGSFTSKIRRLSGTGPPLGPLGLPMGLPVSRVPSRRERAKDLRDRLQQPCWALLMLQTGSMGPLRSTSAAAAVGATAAALSAKRGQIGPSAEATGVPSISTDTFAPANPEQQQQQVQDSGEGQTAAPAASDSSSRGGGGDVGGGGVQSQQLLLRVAMSPPSPVGSCLLLRRPWVLLLRLLLQLGISLQSLLHLSSPPGDHDEQVCNELYDLIPHSKAIPRAPSAAAGRPHESSDSEAEQQQVTLQPPAPGGGDTGGEGWMVSEAGDQMPDNARLMGPSPTLGRSSSLGSKEPKEQKEVLRERLGARSEMPAGSHAQLEQLRQEYVLQRGGSMGSRPSGSCTSLTSLEGWLPNGEGSEVSMEDIVSVLRHVGELRGKGQLLLPFEKLAYAKALRSGLVAERMAVAATVAGDHQEARFWAHLPATLAGVKVMQEAIAAAAATEKRTGAVFGGSGIRRRGASGLSADGAESSMRGGLGNSFCGSKGSGLSVQSGLIGAELPDVKEEASMNSSIRPFLAEGSDMWTAEEEDDFDDGYGVDLGVDADAYDRLVELALEKAAEGMGPQAPVRIGSKTRRQSVVWRGLLPGHVRVTPNTAGGTGAALSANGIRQVASGRGILLWDPSLVLSEAQERALWRDMMPRTPPPMPATTPPLGLLAPMRTSIAAAAAMTTTTTSSSSSNTALLATGTAASGGTGGAAAVGAAGAAGTMLFGSGGPNSSSTVTSGMSEDTVTHMRLLEYVVLGDYSTAVALLLTTEPDSNVRWYRNIAMMMSLAATASLQALKIQQREQQMNLAAGTAGVAGPTLREAPRRTRSFSRLNAAPLPSAAATATAAAASLQLQAAKVISIHAVGVGDTMLAIPLNCAAGLFGEAAAMLGDAGMWRCAAVLAAAKLKGTERAAVLSRWALLMEEQDCTVWRAVGLMTSAGCLRAATQMLQDAGLPDCAEAYVQACEQAGLLIPAPSGPSPSPLSGNAAGSSGAAGGGAAAASAVGGAGRSGQPRTPKTPKTPKAAGHLFDLLGQRHSSHLPGNGRWTARAGKAQQQQQQTEEESRSSPRGQSIPAGDLAITRWEFERYMRELLGKL